MTCRHVLDLIDAEPFVDHPASHLEAAWSHARACETCGPALTASRAMTSRLGGLAQLSAPAELRTSIMARIARLDETVPVATPVAAARPKQAEQTLWPAAACLIVGSALIALAYGITTGDVPFWHARLAGPGMVPDSLTALVVLTSGIGCYVIGLLAPLTRR